MCVVYLMEIHTFCLSYLHAQVGESLHTQLTSLIGRLHEGETKRHAIFLQLEQHKTEVLRLSSACQEALILESQVEKLHKDLAGMVPHEQYLSVCSDLELALKREQELKTSLSHSGSVVRELQSRLQQEGQSTQTKSAALYVLEKASEHVDYRCEQSTFQSYCQCSTSECTVFSLP